MSLLIATLFIIGAIIFFILISILGYWIGTYNKLQVGKQDINTQWSNIKTEYQRRADMLYNLVQSVKSFKNFEKESMTQVIQARSGNFGSTKLEEIKKLKGLDNIFSRLMVVFERYPEFKSIEQHNKLFEEIRITEDRINVARTDYNEIVGDYNKIVRTFPSSLVANHHNIKLEPFFENEPFTDKAPKIEL